MSTESAKRAAVPPSGCRAGGARSDGPVEATVFFARESAKFQLPQRPVPEVDSDGKGDGLALDDVFVIGLEPKRRYHVEVDGEGMFETASDVGGIIYVSGLPAGAQVRFGLANVV
jgi:hypothetical protein